MTDEKTRFSYLDRGRPPVYKGQWAREPFDLECTSRLHDDHDDHRSTDIPMGSWCFWIDSQMGAVLCLECAKAAGHDPPEGEILA